jgi:hypothetical protein
MYKNFDYEKIFHNLLPLNIYIATPINPITTAVIIHPVVEKMTFL